MTRDPDGDDPDRPVSPVRPAVSADASALGSLQEHLPRSAPVLLDHALSSGVGTRLLVSTAGGRPVGYLLAVDGAETHVAELAVAPAYRREGRARGLLGALVARVDPGRRLTVLVATDNGPARSLYRDAGFVVADRRPDAFGSDAPGLLLSRRA